MDEEPEFSPVWALVFAAALLLLWVSGAVGAEPTFTVVNKCPAPFAVENRCAVPSAPAVAYRAPVGHTHTCANGHTWDHSTTPGHTCPVCGLSQYVQDSTPRAVRVSAPNAAPVYAWPSAGTPVLGTQVYAPYSLGSGGCANGSCGVPSAGRFRR